MSWASKKATKRLKGAGSRLGVHPRALVQDVVCLARPEGEQRTQPTNISHYELKRKEKRDEVKRTRVLSDVACARCFASGDRYRSVQSLMDNIRTDRHTLHTGKEGNEEPWSVN